MGDNFHEFLFSSFDEEASKIVSTHKKSLLLVEQNIFLEFTPINNESKWKWQNCFPRKYNPFTLICIAQDSDDFLERRIVCIIYIF